MKHLRHSPPAFSLIEVVIALGIASFCLITVFALLPIGINTNQNAFQQTTAASIATAIASDLHGTPSVSNPAQTGTNSVSRTSRFQIIIPQAGQSSASGTGQTIFFSDDGAPSITNGQGSSAVATQPVTPAAAPLPKYRATIQIQATDTTAQNPTIPPGWTQASTTLVTPRNKLFKVWILVTWPALADPDPSKPPSNFSGSYEAATSLDCN
jgi:type II secretory pathway pseudopilin PulG